MATVKFMENRPVRPSKFPYFLAFLNSLMYSKCMLRAIRLYFCRPKPGDVYLGDAFDFMAGKIIEQVMHGMRDREGNELYTRVDGPGTYKFLLASDSMPYYRLDCQVLVKDNHTSKFEWKSRIQPRRIKKDVFKELIVEGKVKKYDSNY
jgi:hypothetical protein